MLGDQELLERWADAEVLDAQAQAMLRADPARVAQKCTGRAKRPVLVLPRQIAKGPWSLADDVERLQRELGRVDLLRHLLGDVEPSSVLLEPTLWVDPEDGELVYLVYPGLHSLTEPEQWTIEARCASASDQGPRQLEVVSRASLGVMRVQDRMREDTEYASAHPEIWEHLLHRMIAQVGDSGLHNMLVRPVDDRVVAVDLDERRRRVPASDHWLDQLFKARPWKGAVRMLDEARRAQRDYLRALLEQLSGRLQDGRTAQIASDYALELSKVADLQSVGASLLEPAALER